MIDSADRLSGDELQGHRRSRSPQHRRDLGNGQLLRRPLAALDQGQGARDLRHPADPCGARSRHGSPAPAPAFGEAPTDRVGASSRSQSLVTATGDTWGSRICRQPSSSEIPVEDVGEPCGPADSMTAAAARAATHRHVRGVAIDPAEIPQKPGHDHRHTPDEHEKPPLTTTLPRAIHRGPGHKAHRQ